MTRRIAERASTSDQNDYMCPQTERAVRTAGPWCVAAAEGREKMVPEGHDHVHGRQGNGRQQKTTAKVKGGRKIESAIDFGLACWKVGVKRAGNMSKPRTPLFFVVLLLAAAPAISAFQSVRKIAGRRSPGPSSRGWRLASSPEDRVDDDSASADITSGDLSRLDTSRYYTDLAQRADQIKRAGGGEVRSSSLKDLPGIGRLMRYMLVSIRRGPWSSS